MKKEVFFLLSIIVLSLFSNLLIKSINAQDTGVPEVISGINQENIEKITGFVENLSDEQARRQYLSQEWTKILLKNKIIANLDNSLKKVSFIFSILFGESYSFSGTLFLIIVLWIFFLFEYSSIFSNFLPFSNSTGIILALGLTIITAQLKILRLITEFLLWLIFYEEAIWWRFLIFIGIFVLLFVIYYISSIFAKAYKEKKEKSKTELEKANLHEASEASDKILKALSKKHAFE